MLRLFQWDARALTYIQVLQIATVLSNCCKTCTCQLGAALQVSHNPLFSSWSKSNYTEICTFKWQLWRLLSSKLIQLAINYSQKFLKQYLNILHNCFLYTRSANIWPSFRILSMANINKSMNTLIFNISSMINIPLSFKMFSLGHYDISMVLNIYIHYLWWIYIWFLTYW